MLVDPIPRAGSATAAVRWRIGSAGFRRGRHALDLSGTDVVIERAGHELLLRLLAEPGVTVSKAELLAAAWPGRVVTENSLPKAIGKLRAALGDTEGRLIQVVHGHGYRIDAEQVLPLAPEDPFPATAGASKAHERATRPPPRVAILLAVLVILALTAAATWLVRTTAPTAASASEPAGQRLRIQVQATAAGGGATEWLEPLTIALSESLATLPGVEVVSKDMADPSRAGAASDPTRPAADWILSARFDRQPGQVRVWARLVHAISGVPALSAQFHEADPEWEALQGRLVAELTRRIEAELADARFARAPPPSGRKAEAYQRFLEARLLHSDDETGSRRSLVALQEAVELDPEFYEARIALADRLGHTGRHADTAEEALQDKRRALDEVDRAIALRPERPEAWFLRADLRYAHWWDWEGARADLAEGVERSSPDDLLYLNREHRLLAALGRLDEAMVVARETQLRHPTDHVAYTIQTYHLVALGRFAEAERAGHQALALLPTDPHAQYYLGLAQLLQGHPEAAIRRFELSAHELRLTGMAAARHMLGDREGSDRDLAALLARYGHIVPYQVASVHAWRGEADAAFEWLERAKDLRDASLMYLLFDPLLANLHDDPRWPLLLASVNLPMRTVRTRFPVAVAAMP